jgi:voltage-gated potassium channel
MNRAWLLLAASATWIAGSGALFAATQHDSLVAGFYWAVATATTVGYGDVVPHSTGGQVLAIGVMLTGIPLLASTFALATGSRLLERVNKRLDEHHKAIHARLDSISKGKAEQ